MHSNGFLASDAMVKPWIRFREGTPQPPSEASSGGNYKKGSRDFLPMKVPLWVLPLVLPFSVAGADVLYAIEADVSTEGGVAFSGLLVPGPADPRHVGSLHPDASKPPAGQTLVAEARVRLATEQWVSRPNDHLALQYPAPAGAVGQDSFNQSFSSATLRIQLIRPASQLALDDYEDGKKPLGQVNAVGATCRIVVPADNAAAFFPGDPNKVSGTRVLEYRPSGSQLQGDCAMERVNAHRPARIVVYGLDLVLESPELQEPLLIETGTFEEEINEVNTGRRVTRILTIFEDGAPYNFTYPLPLRTRFYADAFAAAGRMEVGPSDGSWQWGGLSQSGALPSIEADGEFEVRRGTSAAYAVEGQTVTSPPVIPSGGRSLLASAAGPPAIAAVVLAVGFAAFHLLWFLYSKIAGERLLDHPRRAQILELVRANPGINQRGVSLELGLHRTIVLYHVGSLRRGGFLTIHRIEGRTALFPANAGYRGREAQLALLRREAHRIVYHSLRQHGPMDQAGLASLMGVSQARISQILAQLSLAGMTRGAPHGRRVLYEAVKQAPLPEVGR